MSLIEIRHAGKGFRCGGKRVEILQDINLDVAAGEFVVIIGYSGSGKTTLVNLLSGLDLADTGSVSVAGKPVTGPDPERGLVFQNYSLLPWLTVEENIGLAVEGVFPRMSAEEQRRHQARYIQMVNLTPAAKKYPRELSGGMRQRVSVARALAMEPKVLLLDEPLSALDALTRANLQDEIIDIREKTGNTVVWITNDPDEAILLADRVIPLTPGPGATLGPAMAIDIPRRRDRKTLHHNVRFKALRTELTQWLLCQKSRQRTTVSQQLTLPDILPEDLTRVNTFQFFNRRGPRRRGDAIRETVEINA